LIWFSSNEIDADVSLYNHMVALALGRIIISRWTSQHTLIGQNTLSDQNTFTGQNTQSDQNTLTGQNALTEQNI
jgi:hypothetical protein